MEELAINPKPAKLGLIDVTTISLRELTRRAPASFQFSSVRVIKNRLTLKTPNFTGLRAAWTQDLRNKTLVST